jgi:FkbM family methyltransferase
MYFDIGANIGKWSLSNVNNCDKIIAIEASPNTFNKLLNNTNNEPKILCLNYAVCNTDEEYIEFYDANTDTISTLNKDWLISEKSRFFNLTNYNKSFKIYIYLIYFKLKFKILNLSKKLNIVNWL